MLNISKNRKFPTLGETRGYLKKDKGYEHTDFYFIYRLNKNQLGDYLNIWFKGHKLLSKKGEIYCDEMWSVIKVNEKTARSLYNKKFNPVEITIRCPTSAKFTYNDNGDILYQMTSRIHSIDDSSFTAYYIDKTQIELESIRNELMLWLSSFKEVDGETWLKKCEELGAIEFNYD